MSKKLEENKEKLKQNPEIFWKRFSTSWRIQGHEVKELWRKY